MGEDKKQTEKKIDTKFFPMLNFVDLNNNSFFPLSVQSSLGPLDIR